MSRLFYLLLLYCSTNVNASPTKTHCQKSLFQCDNGRCVSLSFVCDGEDECGDESDEKDCLNFKLPSMNCTEDEYKCKDSTCIPIEKFCDTRHDCIDESDEYPDCVKDKKCKDFKCKDGYCVRNEWICDGMDDCLDGSDERNCDGSQLPAKECTNEIDRYLCKNGRCISLSQTCNEKDDCGDGSDENVEECKKSEELCSRVEKCGQVCRRTPKGPTCSCRPGHKLINNITCIDVNECEIFGSCYQHCANNDGSYVCSCETGYNLQEDGRSCKADGGEALMYLASKTEIRGYHIDSEIYFPILTNLQHAVGVAVDAVYVYWTDVTYGKEAIMKGAQNGSSPQIIASTGVDMPEDVAVDWVTGNIYFTDSSYQHIAVCDNNGTYCTVIINERTDRPRALALSPKSGIMYWSDWGLNPQIAMASMDGKNYVPFVKENIEWPNGLTIDYPNDRLYWVDAKLAVIESIRLDGRDRRRILSGIVKHPFSIAVFENRLYWTEWMSNTIGYCDKFTGKNWETLFHPKTVPYGIHIYHSVLKPKISNPCSGNPCSQMCLLNSNNSYTCACSMSHVLGDDEHSCRAIRKEEHILVAAEDTLIDYTHEVLGTPKKMSSILTMKHITALAFDSLTGGIFINDQLTNQIYRYNINSGVSEALITVQNELLGGMDFDFVGNNLYWTDRQHKTIEIHSLDTNGKTVFYFFEEPHDIVLAPTERIMFVVLRSGDTYCIDKMQMNGLGTRVHVVEETLTGPKISLAYDRETKTLFWADQGSGRIESISDQDKKKYLRRTGLKEPINLAILGDNIFWVQKGSNSLYWASKSKDTQNIKHQPLQVREDIESMDLVVMHAIYYTNDEHGCRKNNGNCSHVCLPMQNHYICGCPPGMMLLQDNRTCTIQSVCQEDEIKCSEHDVCIKVNQKCDGVKNCPNGEDESNNCEHPNPCSKNQFTCENGECISREGRCNSQYDCKDRSDERNCDDKACTPDEFRCHEGGCISKYLVCNLTPDCPDISDELNCNSHTCSPNDFMCQNGECIPNNWVCDGVADCKNGSDEGETCKQKSCKEDMYKCKNNHCLDKLLLCNGFDDCGDNSDEDHCTNEKPVNCTEDEYNCYNTNICLPRSKKCNGITDCPKNDDERDCPRCQRDEYACENNKCIPQAWVCDRVDDCGDKSDEKYCSGDGIKSRNITTTKDCKEFRCTDGTCLPFSDVCNQYQDCMDGSDENKECAMACTLKNPCSNVCYKTPTGPVCGCSSGYRLAPDGVSCVDVNECEERLCSQICHNTRGSFICSCESGYILQKDRISCKAAGPRMEIITVAGNDVRKNTPTLSSIEVIHHDPNFENYEVDVNVRENTVYLSNDFIGTITKINLETKDKKVLQNIGRPGAIAVDWVTDNVYFYNDERPYAIKACNLEQEKCVKVVTINGIGKVQSINVDPTRGWLFWSQTDWVALNEPKSQIYRSSMAGGNSTAIVTRNLGVIQKLTTDHRKSRLYWCDTQLSVIESSNFDGSDREIFLKTEFLPLDVNVYEDSIYWLSSNTGNIKKCKIHGDRSCTTIFSSQIVTKHFAILHNTRQPLVPNKCQNQDCAYMCLLNEQNFVCVCQNGQPIGNEIECKDDSNVKISSYVSSGNKTNVRQDSGAITGIIVTVVGVLVVLSGYCYYQQLKASPTKKNDLSIHFQNPSYDQKNEVLTSFNCIVSNLPPGEHEYINPIINISAKIDDPIKDTRKIIEVQYSDQSEGESEDSRYTANTKLLR